MESKRASSIIEIGESEVRFLIGYSHSGVAEVLYLSRVPLQEDAIVDGKVIDRPSIVRAIKEAMRVDDEEVARKVDMGFCSLILPPIGFKIYSSDRVTTVVSPVNMVDRVDVSNALALINKEPIPNGNEIVDIVPSVFYLDDGRKLFNAPPLGMSGSRLGVRANVHTLPSEVIHSYRTLLEEAGVRVKRLAVSTEAEASLIKSYNDLPKAYFLIDMGKGTTKVALVGESTPISSVLFAYGGEDVDLAIASGLSVGLPEATHLKERYGYRPGPKKEAEVELGPGSKVRLEDLAKALEAAFHSYDNYISNSILTIAQDYGSDRARLERLPLVFVGGMSSLFGIEGLLPKTLKERQGIFLRPRPMGARHSALAAMLGYIVSEGSYRGSLEEHGVGVSSLSRLSRSS